MTREYTKRRVYALIYGGTVIDFNSRAWHRAIAATPDVVLILLKDGEAFNGLPRVHWKMPVRGTLVECRADPMQGSASNVRVQVVRPGDPPFDEPIAVNRRPTHDTFGQRVRPPTNEIMLEENPTAAWSHLWREAKILAFGGALLAALAMGCAAGGAPVLPDGGVQLDAAVDAATDAAAAAPDAAIDAAGLGLDADCDPTRDECAAGLTCRPDGKLRGNCRPVGALPAGALCQAESDCGYAMTWFSDQAGAARCAVICNTEAPLQRCKPNQPCWSLVGRLGICAP